MRHEAGEHHRGRSRWMKPALSKPPAGATGRPPSSCTKLERHAGEGELMKLTISSACRTRFRRVKRWYWSGLVSTAAAISLALVLRPAWRSPLRELSPRLPWRPSGPPAAAAQRGRGRTARRALRGFCRLRLAQLRRICRPAAARAACARRPARTCRRERVIPRKSEEPRVLLGRGASRAQVPAKRRSAGWHFWQVRPRSAGRGERASATRRMSCGRDNRSTGRLG